MDFDRRLSALRDRRLGISKLQKTMDSVAFATASQRSLLTEKYQQRTSAKACRYVLGAMEEVKPDYTAISIEEGTRIGKQLINRLPLGWSMECELQGSVPLNVHIEGVSDVDLLTLRTDYCTFDAHGPKANQFNSPPGPSTASLLSTLRQDARAALVTAYPACTIDASGGKSLCMTGGSLRRKVDVVPSMWKHTAAFQAYGQNKDKGVVIYDKNTGLTSNNLPFLHIHEVHEKDRRTAGGTKKVVRLLKTVKEDSDDKESIALSSYDIAGLVWHMDEASLIVHPWAELSLLAVAQLSLRYWRENKSAALALPTPDGTRKIVQDDAKFRGLQLLSIEIDRLAEQVAAEIDPSVRLYPSMLRNTVPAALRKAYMPVSL